MIMNTPKVSNQKYFKLETGEMMRTKIFLDVPDCNLAELYDYIEKNYGLSRLIWKIEYELYTVQKDDGSLCPIVDIVIPRWIWVKEKYRNNYTHQNHLVYMKFVKVLLDYEAMKKREQNE